MCSCAPLSRGSPGVFYSFYRYRYCTSVPVLYDVKRISFCPTRYWPKVAVASSRGGALEYRASHVRTEYEAAASALDARTAAWYIRTGPPSQSEHRRQSISSPRSLRFAAWYSAAPLAGGLGRSASSLLRLRRRQPSVSGVTVALAWRPLHARRAVLHDLDAALSGRLRRGRAHARLRLSRLELIGGSGRTAGRYASAARAFFSPTAFEQARGGALGAGGGRVGFAGGGLF